MGQTHTRHVYNLSSRDVQIYAVKPSEVDDKTWPQWVNSNIMQVTKSKTQRRSIKANKQNSIIGGSQVNTFESRHIEDFCRHSGRPYWNPSGGIYRRAERGVYDQGGPVFDRKCRIQDFQDSEVPCEGYKGRNYLFSAKHPLVGSSLFLR